MRRLWLAGLIALFLAMPIWAEGPTGTAPNATPNSTAAVLLENWRKAVLAGDADALRRLYAAQPQVLDPRKEPIRLDDEIQFWASRKKEGLTGMEMEIVKVDPPEKGIQAVRFEAELKSNTPAGPRTHYVVAVQGWETGASPKIAVEMRTGLLRLKQPTRLNPKLYDPQADAKLEIKEALERAAPEHKNVLLVFGGNWCYDCHVLDLAFHHPEVQPILDAHYIVVHVDVGEFDKNLDLVEKYELPLKKGVPALAVVAPDGKLVFSQRNGEFESARSLAPEDVIAFLEKWEPKTR